MSAFHTHTTLRETDVIAQNIRTARDQREGLGFTRGFLIGVVLALPAWIVVVSAIVVFRGLIG